MESKIKKIDRALSSLSKDEYLIVTNYYIEGKHIYEFTHELGISESHCRRIKDRAINKIKIALYGVQVKN
ncbi:sigma factor-like helix-turn-helix DNA-binding protein [Clostridium omnivorum]